MNINKLSRKILFTLTGLLCFGNANAIPVTMVDIDAMINDTANTVDRNLAAGTYRVEVIGTADGGAYNAWNAWGKTSCGNTAGCDRTGATKYKGWLNKYSFASSDLVDVRINGALASPTAGMRYDVNPYMAFPDELSALAQAWTAMFTLNTASVVSFMITDSFLTDNLGGMSLKVMLDVPPGATADVPEPSVLSLVALAGLLCFGYSYRRKV